GGRSGLTVAAKAFTDLTGGPSGTSSQAATPCTALSRACAAMKVVLAPSLSTTLTAVAQSTVPCVTVDLTSRTSSRDAVAHGTTRRLTNFSTKAKGSSTSEIARAAALRRLYGCPSIPASLPDPKSAI